MHNLNIEDTLIHLVGGLNLSRKWEAMAKESGDVNEGFRLETLREYIENAVRSLSTLAGGYVPCNLDGKL